MSYHVSMIYSYAKKIKDIRASPHNNCRPPGRGRALAGRSRLEAGGVAGRSRRVEAGAGGSGMRGGRSAPQLEVRRGVGGADGGKPPPVRGRGRG